MDQQKKWEIYAQKYNKEEVMKLTGLNEAYADTFMLWFNSRNLISYTADEYQIRASIIEHFTQFKQDYGLEK